MGAQSQTDVNDGVSAALDAGINLFDAPDMYNDGASEVSLGIASQWQQRGIENQQARFLQQGVCWFRHRRDIRVLLVCQYHFAERGYT